MDVEEVVDVVVEIAAAVVVVLVVGGNSVVVVVVVYIVPTIGRSTYDEAHNPLDFTLIIVAPLGTDVDKYPATSDAFGTLTSNGLPIPGPATNPYGGTGTSQYRSKGPVSEPAMFRVINTVCAIY